MKQSGWCCGPCAARTPKAFFVLRQDPVAAGHTGLPVYTSLWQAEDYINTRLRDVAEGDCFFWAVTLRGAGAFAGGACLFGLRAAEGIAEVGYELLKEYRGHGYAAEAVAAVVDYAFNVQGLGVVEALPHEGNTPSHRLLERCGFKLEGKADTGEGGLPLLRYAARNPALKNTQRNI